MLRSVHSRLNPQPQYAPSESGEGQGRIWHTSMLLTVTTLRILITRVEDVRGALRRARPETIHRMLGRMSLDKVASRGIPLENN